MRGKQLNGRNKKKKNFAKKRKNLSLFAQAKYIQLRIFDDKNLHKILCDEAIEGFSCCLKEGWNKIIFYKKENMFPFCQKFYIYADACKQYNPTNKLTIS